MAINVVLETDDLTVLGPPASIDLQVDIGPAGERGSYIYSGSVDPNVSSTPFLNLPPKIGDLYFRTSTNSVYQYLTIPGGEEWVELLTFNLILTQAEDAYDSALDLSMSAISILDQSIFYANLAEENALSASAFYLTDQEADETYLSLTSAENIYLTKEDASTIYLDLNTASAALPSQSGNDGRFLTTNGSVASWSDLSSQINSASAAAASYTDSEISSLIDSAPGNLNTLGELAAAIDNDFDFHNTISNTYLTQANAAIQYSPRLFVENIQSSDYTLQLSDINKVIAMDNSASATVIVPLNSTVAFPIGTVINVYRMNEGLVFVSPEDESVVVHNDGYIYNLYGEVSLRKRGLNEWVLSGNVL